MTVSDEFSIVQDSGGEQITILRVTGPLDAQHAPKLLAACSDICKSGHSLVLNMTAVTLIASSGIGALLALVEEFRQADTGVRIAEASPAVDSVVRLLNLERFLHLDTSETESLGALKAA